MSQAPNTLISRPDVSGPNAPEFDAIAKHAKDNFGYLNFTVFEWIEDRFALRRIWSSDPKDYPVNGEKVMPKEAPWPNTVIKQHKSHVSWNSSEIKSTYNDYQALFDLGVHQTLSIPILDEKNEKVIGALNYSAGENQYNENTLKEMEKIAQNEAKQAFLKWQSNQK
ncbi:uncharacterized protein L201_000333 [Kwoniella dendrophila CBS 6074]|uniref:GAF domain-containing protein n=1 Tax=Kwoniella dendrophila CBS 6074 TaxID=1295534 RepID=A0AAX4JJ46_9TREE